MGTVNTGVIGLPHSSKSRFDQTESRLMHTDARVNSLQEKHLRLDRAILDEEKRSWPDESAVKRLKLEKLHVKEEMDRLTKTSNLN
jgi:uncharacterized protein